MSTKTARVQKAPSTAKRFDRFYRHGFASAPLALSNGFREGPPAEFTVVSIREALPYGQQFLCEEPKHALQYWNAFIATSPWFKPEQEQLVVLMLTTRCRVIGHVMCGLGTLNESLVSPRDVFRAAIVVSAASVVMMHNHPGGDPAPSDADVKATKDVLSASRVVRIKLMDHVIVAGAKQSSFKSLGYIPD